jgi:putative ABC transport system permease protein
MSLWRHLSRGLFSLTHRSAHHDEVSDEVEHYFEEAANALMQRGLTPEQAIRAARIEAGNMSIVKERVSSYGWENLARIFFADLRFAARQLRKHPVFTVTATLTLALGIGANTAIFTVVQSVLLAPLPYNNPDRLAALNTHWADSGHTSLRVTGPDAADLRSQAKGIQAMSLYGGGSLGVQLRDHTTFAVVSLVDSNFPTVFSLEPAAGRLFTNSDAHHAALVGESFARDNFGSASAAVGQTIRVENAPLEITGVLPAGFDFPARTQVWMAQPLEPESKSRTAFNYKAVALLRQGVSFQTAQAELNGISQRLESAYPVDNRHKQFIAQPLQQALTGDARPTLLLLWATVALILLIACVNVTHLQLVRSMERQRELAIRKALGCSRGQVMQPVILESLMVALIGATAGVLLALPAVRILVAMAPKELPRGSEIHLNGWVLAFTLGLSVLTALVSSILPAVNAAKVNPADALKSDTSRGMGRRRTSRLRDAMVIAEVAATFVLAMGAGLLLHTMMTLRSRDLGYLTRQLLVVDADAPANSDKEAAQTVQQFNQLFLQLSALPGVERVAGIMGLPTGNYGSNGYYNTRGGLPAVPGHAASSIFSVASPGYFQTMRIPVERGRDFNAADTFDSPFVAVISKALAWQSFGDADPVGKQIQCGLDSDKWMTIIGVVGDVRQESPAEQPGPALYMPMTQHPYYANQIHIVLRTHVTPLTLLNPVQALISRTNPAIALRFTTMDALVSKSIAAERFRAALISCFAGAAIILAMLGVYGTMAYSVTQRTFEIGIRMAFGAEKSAILASVLKHAALLASLGIAAGLVLSMLLSRLVASMLVGVRPTDPLSIVAAALLLLLTALAAAFAPGWRATHVNPMVALRTQ